MSRESIVRSFCNLKQEAGVAPHKPLLALYALSQWLHIGTTVFRFIDLERPVGNLIRDAVFGAAPSATARDPFWFLQSDGVWVVESAAGPWRGTGRPTLEELRNDDARGRFADHVISELERSPGLSVELIGRLLCVYFEPEHHRPLLGRLGLWTR
jgi:hypothetical protein